MTDNGSPADRLDDAILRAGRLWADALPDLDQTAGGLSPVPPGGPPEFGAR